MCVKFAFFSNLVLSSDGCVYHEEIDFRATNSFEFDKDTIVEMRTCSFARCFIDLKTIRSKIERKGGNKTPNEPPFVSDLSDPYRISDKDIEIA